MASINIQYHVARVLLLTPSVIAFILFTIEALYVILVHRKVIKRPSDAKQFGKVKVEFHRVGVVFSFFYMLNAIDQWGVFGVLTLEQAFVFRIFGNGSQLWAYARYMYVCNNVSAKIKMQKDQMTCYYKFEYCVMAVLPILSASISAVIAAATNTQLSWVPWHVGYILVFMFIASNQLATYRRFKKTVLSESYAKSESLIKERIRAVRRIRLLLLFCFVVEIAWSLVRINNLRKALKQPKAPAYPPYDPAIFDPLRYLSIFIIDITFGVMLYYSWVRPRCGSSREKLESASLADSRSNQGRSPRAPKSTSTSVPSSSRSVPSRPRMIASVSVSTNSQRVSESPQLRSISPPSTLSTPVTSISGYRGPMSLSSSNASSSYPVHPNDIKLHSIEDLMTMSNGSPQESSAKYSTTSPQHRLIDNLSVDEVKKKSGSEKGFFAKIVPSLDIVKNHRKSIMDSKSKSSGYSHGLSSSVGVPPTGIEIHRRKSDPLQRHKNEVAVQAVRTCPPISVRDIAETRTEEECA